MTETQTIGSGAEPRQNGHAKSAVESAAWPTDHAAGSTARLGRIVAVTGSQAVMLLDRPDDAARPQLQVGSLVAIRAVKTTVFGIISGLTVPAPTVDASVTEHRLAELELLGENAPPRYGRAEPFQRGVSVFPALGDAVYQASPEAMRQVFSYTAKAAVRIGTIHDGGELPALVSVDDLLGKHFALLGSTGTGKSCAVALILRAILEQHAAGHVVVLDMHDEYSRAFGESAEVLTAHSLRLPYWLLAFEELEEIVLGDSHDRDAQAQILSDVVLAAKRAYLGDAEKTGRLTVDTPVPYRLGDAIRLIDEAVGKNDRPGAASSYLRLKARLSSLQLDPRYEFMFGGITVHDNMAAILSGLFRIPVAGKPVTIVDLSGVPSEIINVVVSVLCRMVFDFALWSERSVPILLVCEEAHRYAPQQTGMGFEPAKRALYRIAKEGRKYGVSLCVVSQRPSELSADILSQCSTIFALRLTNIKDQEFIRGVLAESALGLMSFLPSLRNAEAIALGEGVPVPMRLTFDELPDDIRPHSGTASFSDGWGRDRESSTFVEGIVDRWRRRRRC